MTLRCAARIILMIFWRFVYPKRFSKVNRVNVLEKIKNFNIIMINIWSWGISWRRFFWCCRRLFNRLNKRGMECVRGSLSRKINCGKNRRKMTFNVIWELLLMESDISWYENFVCDKIISLVCLLSKRVTNENSWICSSIKFASSLFDARNKTQTTKHLHMTVIGFLRYNFSYGEMKFKHERGSLLTIYAAVKTQSLQNWEVILD